MNDVMIDEQDRPVTIRKACQIVFNGEIGPDGFRSLAKRVGLPMMRVGHKDFVTIRDVMTCLRNQNHPGSSSTEPEAHTLSRTVLSESEQALALKAKLRLVPNEVRF